MPRGGESVDFVILWASPKSKKVRGSSNKFQLKQIIIFHFNGNLVKTSHNKIYILPNFALDFPVPLFARVYFFTSK